MKAAFRRIVARIFERQVRRLIKRHQLIVVAVGGSVGKTTTRAAIAQVLQAKYRVQNITNPGYNSEIGLPLSVFDMSVPAVLINPFAWIVRLIQTEFIIGGHYPGQVLVLELGTEEPGEIPRYLRYLKPDIGVVTAVTPEHMQNFPGGLDEVAAEELALAPASGTIIINDDAVPEKYQHKYLAHHPHVLKYGAHHRISLPDAPHVLGDHMRLALQAATLVARELKVPADDIEHAIADIHPVAGRMNQLSGLNGSVIIDDTYNSSPDAVVAALDTLAKFPTTGRRIALLGSMNELGQHSPAYHEATGRAAAGVDLLVTVGDLAGRYLGPAAVREGLDPTRYRAADSPYAAADYLALILRPGDVLLAKGSQNGVFAEEAVKLLLAHPSDAKLLVRQSPAWTKAKRSQFKDFK
jgi:UDP-N-acetylmuramyl pentapeptide synthase